MPITVLTSHPEHLCVLTYRLEGQEGESILYVGSKEHPRIVVFDSLITAQDFVYRLAGGRMPYFGLGGDSFTICPIVAGNINCGKIWLGYDPYNVPTDWLVPSERSGKEWRYHINHWLAFSSNSGNFKELPDGSVLNLAVDEHNPIGVATL
jgi:hypothetical protein